MPKRYNTPHRTRVIKTRMTEEEYEDFSESLAVYGMNQSEFIRQSIRKAAIHPIIKTTLVSDELLAAVGKLTAELGRIGNNLNQIARHLNEFGTPYHLLEQEVRSAISELAAVKFELLKKLGDAIGNDQTYRL